MKIGDQVRIKNTIESADYFGFYANSDALIKEVNTSYCQVELFDGKVVMSPVDFLEPIYNIYKNKNCECGAWATSFSNFHALYCPLYKDQT